MESALRPRDIQARIRAGASPEQVALAAGVPVERIDAFAAPVVAERDYIAGLARSNPVRRRGETTSHRTLRNAVADALAARGVDVDGADWDAWKLEDRRWRVRVGYEVDGARHEGLFLFDAMGRFSVSADDEGRTLIGDGGSDELALVQATQEGAAESEEPSPDEEEADEAALTDKEEDEVDDAFHEGDLTQVDGVYDIVPPARGDLDALYDMLSSFDEDSVKIYAGLLHPKESTHEQARPVVVDEGEDAGATPPAEVPSAAHEGMPVEVVSEAPEELPVEAPSEAAEEVPVEPDEEPTGLVPPGAAHTRSTEAKHEDEPGAPPAGTGEALAPAVAELEQDALIDGVEEPAPKPQPRSRRKRASVPSWDEIMFGAPHAPKSDG